MNTHTFERRLIDFFNRHDSSNVGMAGEIAEKFAGKEEMVFSALNEYYLDKPSGVSREMIGKTIDSYMKENTGNVPA